MEKPPHHRSRILCPHHCPSPSPASGHEQKAMLWFWRQDSQIFVGVFLFPKKKLHTCCFSSKYSFSSSSTSLKPSNSSSLSDWLNSSSISAVMNLDLKHGACRQIHKTSSWIDVQPSVKTWWKRKKLEMGHDSININDEIKWKYFSGFRWGLKK